MPTLVIVFILGIDQARVAVGVAIAMAIGVAFGIAISVAIRITGLTIRLRAKRQTFLIGN